MAVPKRRQSNARSGTRRAHHFVTAKQVKSCPQCSQPIPTHVVCPNCGHYEGRTIIDMTGDKK